MRCMTSPSENDAADETKLPDVRTGELVLGARRRDDTREGEVTLERSREAVAEGAPERRDGVGGFVLGVANHVIEPNSREDAPHRLDTDEPGRQERALLAELCEPPSLSDE